MGVRDHPTGMRTWCTQPARQQAVIGLARRAVVAGQRKPVERCLGSCGGASRQRRPSGAAHDLVAQPIGVLASKRFDGQSIRDRPHSCGDPLGRPQLARGLDDPGLVTIRHQKAVVIAERPILQAASTALAVSFEQVDDGGYGGLGAGGSLKREAHHVHARESDFRQRLIGKHRLVADCDTRIVHTHLGAPHPKGAAEDHGVRGLDLGHLDVRAGDRRTCFRTGIFGACDPGQHLAFVDVAIGVLGEPDTIRIDPDDRVTHRRLRWPRRPPFPHVAYTPSRGCGRRTRSGRPKCESETRR